MQTRNENIGVEHSKFRTQAKEYKLYVVGSSF